MFKGLSQSASIGVSLLALLAAYVAGVSVGRGKEHWPAKYSSNMGLPENCSAYVQESVNGYRDGRYKASDAMAGLERNCGALGSLWTEKQ